MHRSLFPPAVFAIVFLLISRSWGVDFSGGEVTAVRAKTGTVIDGDLSDWDLSAQRPGSLRHLFIEHGGPGLNRLLNQTRIERVKELLVHSRLPIKEIASMSGFKTERYLSTRFKQFTGVGPSAFRRESLRIIAVDHRGSPVFPVRFSVRRVRRLRSRRRGRGRSG